MSMGYITLLGFNINFSQLAAMGKENLPLCLGLAQASRTSLTGVWVRPWGRLRP